MSKELPDSYIDDRNALNEILGREQVKVGIDGQDMMDLVPGQPFHRVGLMVLRDHPVLWVVVFAQAVLVGLLVYEVCFLSTSGARVPTGETRLILLGAMSRWLQMHSVVFYRFPVAAAVLAAVPYFVLLNLFWSVACGVICRQRFSWRWLGAGLLGLVPLKIVGPQMMARWSFWRGDHGMNSIGVGRFLQFSTVFMLVNRLSMREMRATWLAVMDRRLRDVVDSYGSFVYVPFYIGVVLFLLFYLIAHNLPDVLWSWMLVWEIPVAWAIYSSLNRSLLGLATFYWLNTRGLPVAPEPVARLRVWHVIGFAVIGTAAVMGVNGRYAGKQPVEMVLARPFAKEPLVSFLARNFSSEWFVLPVAMPYTCWSKAGEIKYVGAQLSVVNQPTVMAEVRGDSLRYLPGRDMDSAEGCQWQSWWGEPFQPAYRANSLDLPPFRVGGRR